MRWTKFMAIAPGVGVSFSLAAVAASVLGPAIAGVAWLLFVAAGGVLATPVFRNWAIGFLTNARALTLGEMSIVAPSLDALQAKGLVVPQLLVRQGRPGHGPLPFGRDIVTLPPQYLYSRALGLGDDVGVAIAIAHARARGDALGLRWEITLRWWLLPAAGAGRVLRRLGRFAGRHRLISGLVGLYWLFTIAAVASALQQHTPAVAVLAVGIALLGHLSTSSYRRWQSHAEQSADQVIANAGWAEEWIYMLTNWRDPNLVERSHLMRSIDPVPADTPTRRLHLVVG